MDATACERGGCARATSVYSGVTFVEAARLKVKRVSGAWPGGRILGEVEEYFAQGLTPGDTFFFAGEACPLQASAT